jgi:hypothetical protein
MDNNRKLKTMYIRYNNYWKEQWSYTGSIGFENWQEESFKFRIDKETTKKYMQLISKEVVKSASKLGDDILESLKEQDLLIR